MFSNLKKNIYFSDNLRICRLCLLKGNENQIISVWENQTEDLARKIWNCVSINILKNDTLPTSACLSCINQIKQWENFRSTCQKSNELLLQAIKIGNVEIDILNDAYDLDVGVKANSNEEIGNQTIVIAKSEPICSDLSDKDDYDEFENSDYLNTEILNYKTECNDNSYECEICFMILDNCFDFLDHQEVHNGNPVFKCDKCPEVFNYRKTLVEHDRYHRMPCPHCCKMVLKSSMKLHLVKHTDRYKCLDCGTRFNSKAALTQHTITVHTNIKDHVCDVCGKQFSSQTAMRVHMRSHSEERLFSCKLCDYAGRTASALYVHMSTHANDVCACDTCPKTFKSTRNLNDHIRRVHSKIKKHSCSYCDKKFVDKYMLSVHVRSHTGIRPYQCSLCKRAFIRSDGLKEHMIIHGKRTIYECKNCGKKFTSKRSISRHNCISTM